jgi:hypothetical protein
MRLSRLTPRVEVAPGIVIESVEFGTVEQGNSRLSPFVVIRVVPAEELVFVSHEAYLSDVERKKRQELLANMEAVS